MCKTCELLVGGVRKVRVYGCSYSHAIFCSTGYTAQKYHLVHNLYKFYTRLFPTQNINFSSVFQSFSPFCTGLITINTKYINI